MATIKVPSLVQSCKSCGKKLLEGTTYNGLIGSPLITCRHCKTLQVTPLRTEWYKYEAKSLLWIWPVVMAPVAFVSGLIVGEDLAIGAVAAILGLILGLCLSGKTIIQMLLSKRRMRDEKYLNELLVFGVISREEYLKFLEKAK